MISTCDLEAYNNLALVHCFFSTVAISLHLAYNQILIFITFHAQKLDMSLSLSQLIARN